MLLDEFSLKVTYLDEEMDLIRPIADRSVAGILPEMIAGWNLEVELPTHLVRHEQVRKAINESFPSGYDHILLVMVDGLGAADIIRLGGPIADNIRTSGTIASSVFPTITSTVMSSFHYGATPSDHGVVGYNIYNEHLDEIWNALRLRFKNSQDQLERVLDHVSLDQLVSGESLSGLIHHTSPGSIQFYVPSYLKPPGLGNILSPVFPQTGYDSIEQGLSLVSKQLQRGGNQFVLFYIPEPDSIAHEFGPNDPRYDQSVQHVESIVKQLCSLPQVSNGSTLVLLTSDHGLHPVNHKISPPMTPKQLDYYKSQGTIFSFSGNVVHVYAQNNLNKSRNLVEGLIDDRNSMLLEKSEAIDLAGGNTRHSAKFGDFTVISAGEYHFHVPNSLSTQPETVNLGQHGGLSSRELFVPVGIFSGKFS